MCYEKMNILFPLIKISQSFLKMKMRFSCKLYNRITGAMILVTNGEMVGLFGKISLKRDLYTKSLFLYK